MRTLVVIVALVSVAGTLKGGGSAQAERPFVFYRICNIAPGQDTAALALAEKMVGLASKKYPSAQMAVRQGRWMTGFQEIAQPVNQLLFMEQHPNPVDQQNFTDVLLADDDFQVLQRKIGALLDVNSCVNSQFRANP